MIHIKHGCTRRGSVSKLYKVWAAIKQRCCNPRNPKFKNYGGRGIQMEADWRDNYVAFAFFVENALGPRPEGRSLDRIDNDKGYLKGNLRWGTPAQQNSNKRTNRFVDFEGQSLTVAQFSRLIGVNKRRALYHLNKGRTPAQIAERYGYCVKLSAAA